MPYGQDDYGFDFDEALDEESPDVEGDVEDIVIEDQGPGWFERRRADQTPRVDVIDEPQPPRQAPPPLRSEQRLPPVRAENVRTVAKQPTQLVGLLGFVADQPILAAAAAGAAGWYLAPKKHRIPIALGCVIGGYVLAAFLLPQFAAGKGSS